MLAFLIFAIVMALLVQKLNEAGGGGGMMQWLRDSEGVTVEVDGELIGEISLGDKESMLSTPLSDSDIAAGILEVCWDDDKVVLPDAKILLEDNEAQEYGGGGRIAELIPNG